MTSTVDLGDVYVCVFPFTSGQGAKARPVLVLMDLGPDCLVCRMTSVPHRGFLDLPVTHWQEAGLENHLQSGCRVWSRWKSRFSEFALEDWPARI